MTRFRFERSEAACPPLSPAHRAPVFGRSVPVGSVPTRALSGSGTDEYRPPRCPERKAGAQGRGCGAENARVIDLDALAQAAACLDPLPASVVRLAGVVASGDPDLGAIAEVVSFDQALTAGVLRT